MRRLHHVFASEVEAHPGPLTIVALGHFKREKYFKLPQGRPSWTLVLFETPVAILALGARRQVGAFTAMLFPPGRPLSYGHEKDFRHYFICAGGAALIPWVRRHGVPVETPIRCGSAAFFADALHRMDQELYAQAKPHATFLGNVFENLLIDLARAARPEPTPPVDPRLFLARRMIETRYPEALRLADIAAVAGLSRFRFSRAFRAAFGMAPIERLIGIRLAAAREKLLSTSKPIGEIALEVGFHDAAHFSKLFARHLGQNPSACRRGKKTPAGA
jgi:AraC-like DNA-binding protein